LSELTKRILFALIAAPLFIGIVWLGDWYFRITLTAVALIIQWEMACMFGVGDSRPNRLFMYLIGIWVMLLPYVPYTALIGLGLFLFLVLTEIIRGSSRSYNSLVNTIFCGIYAPIGVLTLILIRDKLVVDELAAFTLTLIVVFMVWGNDVFAFIFGKNFGKRLLAPQISPKKTWEGFIGGILGSAVAFYLIYFLIPHFPYAVIYGLPMIIIVSVFGPIGDLAASKLKRLYGAKDSSNMLPGHGGFFDRFDALLLAAPAVYLYLEVLRISGML
jgi:phosphatidate cytidylyltransferase